MELKAYEYTVENMTVEYDSHRINGKIYIPEKEGICPAVILSHGYNGGHPQYENECRYFASHGYISYAFDFCGGSSWTSSSGDSTEMTIFTEKSDLLAVIDHVISLDKVDIERVFLLGGSQGGLITALAAEERADNIKGLILNFPALNIPDDWRRKYPNIDDIPEVTEFWDVRLGREFFVSMHDYFPLEEIGKFMGEVIIFEGDCDYIVPMDTAKSTSERYKHSKLVVLKGEGHGFSESGNKFAMEMSLDFMNSIN